jgi:hypothetical protein
MIVFSSFFDGSGHRDDPESKVVTVAGCASSEKKWPKFEREWRVALRAEGITIFHMKDFAHSTGEFKGWRNDEPRRRRFIASLQKVILARTSRRFSATVLLEHYRTVDRQFAFHERVGQPFTVAAQFAMTQVHQWMEDNHPRDGMLYAFEDGDSDKAELRRMTTELRWLEVEPIFIKKKADAGVPLQAADFVAYEHAKLLNDYLKSGKTSIRRSALPLLPRMKDRGTQYLDTRTLMILCRGLHVPRRAA